MNTTNKTVLNVLSQPTNADGSRKAGVWPTKGHDMLETGIINVEITDTGASINGKSVTTATLTAKAMQPVFEGGESLAQWLGYMEQGFVTFQQQRAGTGSTPISHAGAVIDESLMTADEREEYYISLLVPNSPNVVALCSTANNASIDIESRITAATELVTQLKTYKKALSEKHSLSQEQQDSLALQREREARFDTLIEAGATISKSRSRDTIVYAAKCALADAASVISIIQNDFVMIGSPSINMSDMTSVATFKDKDEA